MHRSRIRVTLFGENGAVPQATDLHEHSLHSPIETIDTLSESLSESDAKKYKSKKMIIVPYLALNEVR